jgi:hypothetical protein
MMTDAEVYDDYSRYAASVARITPMPFEAWARKRDSYTPFRAWFENELTGEDEEHEHQDPRVEPRVIPPNSFEIEAPLQSDALALFQQIVSTPPSLALSDEIPMVDLNRDELDGQVLNVEAPQVWAEAPGDPR